MGTDGALAVLLTTAAVFACIHALAMWMQRRGPHLPDPVTLFARWQQAMQERDTWQQRAERAEAQVAELHGAVADGLALSTRLDAQTQELVQLRRRLQVLEAEAYARSHARPSEQ